MKADPMSGRTDTYHCFAERFHSGKRVRPADESQLAVVEETFRLLLPKAYRQFALTCGSVYSPDIADLILIAKAKFSSVQQFLTLKQLTTETRRWKLDATGKYVVIASDCSGNWFAFRNLTNAAPRPDDAPVWLFDLEGEEVKIEAESFTAWIARFLALPEKGT